MSMVRINADIREHVINALLSKKYVKEELELAKLKEAEKEAAEAAHKMAYEAVYNAGQRKLLETSPDGYFPKAKHVMIRVADKDNPDNYNDKYAEFGEEKPVFFRNSGWVNQFAVVIDHDHPYVKALEHHRDLGRELAKAIGELRNKKYADRRRIEVIVNSVTTVKRLQEIWPEVIDYLPETVSGPGGTLPVEIIADINKEFGLNKADETA